MLPFDFLTPRLNVILEQVPPCAVLCDVGTDHAYIPIAAVRSGRATFAYATDVHEGPVKKARENVALYGLSKQIEVRLGNGIEPLLGTHAEVVVIAGMGGCLITEILQKQIHFASNCSRLILQPMREVDVLRRFLCKNGWLFEEQLVREDRRFYHVLTVFPQTDFRDKALDEWDFKFGVCWLKNDPLFKDEATFLIDERQRIEEGIVSDNPQSLNRKEECRLEREFLKKVVEDDETVRN